MCPVHVPCLTYDSCNELIDNFHFENVFFGTRLIGRNDLPFFVQENPPTDFVEEAKRGYNERNSIEERAGPVNTSVVH